MKNICEIKKFSIYYHQFIIIKHCILKNLFVLCFNAKVNHLIYIIINKRNISRELCNCIVEIYFLDFRSAQNEFICFCDVVKDFVINDQSFVIKIVDFDNYHFVDWLYSFVQFIDLYIYLLIQQLKVDLIYNRSGIFLFTQLLFFNNSCCLFLVNNLLNNFNFEHDDEEWHERIMSTAIIILNVKTSWLLHVDKWY